MYEDENPCDAVADAFAKMSAAMKKMEGPLLDLTASMSEMTATAKNRTIVDELTEDAWMMGLIDGTFTISRS